MGQPNSDRAEVDLRKLTEYCLSPTHPVGKHKAALFRSVLGLTADDAVGLRERPLRAAIDGEAVTGRADEFGDRYQLDFEVVTQSGRALVRSAWMVRRGEDFPRLTTCFVLPRRASSYRNEADMASHIKLLDTVAVTADVLSLGLTAGEVGAVVEVLDDGEVFEVEFCDESGTTYGLHTLRATQLIALHHRGRALRLRVGAA